MKIYLSYWSKPTTLQENHQNISVLSFTNKCLNFLKKSGYKDIYLFTDYAGESLYRNLKWNNIYTDLEQIPEEYKDVWSLGKIKSYNLISKIGDPFIHIDYDFFITRPIPENIINSEIITQSIEPSLEEYFVDIIKDKIKKNDILSSTHSSIAYNCGLIGGKDLDFFDKYSTSALNLILDPENKNTWLKNSKDLGIKPWSKAVFMEQYYLSLCLKYYNRNCTTLFETMVPDLMQHRNGWYDPTYMEIFKRTGILHICGETKKDVFIL